MRFEPPRPRSNEERILPLVNVVFLLLIFFMLAGRIAASDPFEVEPPRSGSEGTAELQELVVLVAADGRLAFNGEVIAESALQEAVSRSLSRSSGSPVRLKADSAAEATAVVAVMETLREAGVERLELLTVPERR